MSDRNLFQDQDVPCAMCGWKINPLLDACPQCGWMWKFSQADQMVLDMPTEQRIKREPISSRPLEWQETPVVKRRPKLVPPVQAAGPHPGAIMIAFAVCLIILTFMLGRH